MRTVKLDKSAFKDAKLIKVILSKRASNCNLISQMPPNSVGETLSLYNVRVDNESGPSIMFKINTIFIKTNKHIVITGDGIEVDLTQFCLDDLSAKLKALRAHGHEDSPAYAFYESDLKQLRESLKS